MRRVSRLLLLPLLRLPLALSIALLCAGENFQPDFDMTASYIEACSCDMFCPCYFNTHSTESCGHG